MDPKFIFSEMQAAVTEIKPNEVKTPWVLVGAASSKTH